MELVVPAPQAGYAEQSPIGDPMKLIYCPDCLDMTKLRKLELRWCACGNSWGYYLEDDLTAEIGGSAVPIAIENDELREAVLRRPRNGRGLPVEARVLPKTYETLRHRDSPNPTVRPASEQPGNRSQNSGE
jgi:hypothetical protein